jgi:hypothetical protein
MLSDAMTGLIFGVGFGGWVYFKLLANTGGHQKSALIGGLLAGAGGFFVIFTLIKFVFHF